ncbi:hypothetical protein PPERSA_02148 [Pseudocohnilembus persalinus]|uniref:Uncharacterized protein n=1 Tax=Pseudocohnilembus persalinus TaxID=266149 RepID=A0A0V0Q7N8_PSEPJ|nr:hypothetical protein PPERSA_02148 [Pseudocohnilembus persalinus]|eukprot:KRW98170.1 hypothetical protein PPERSA_02148 [Pseudocohnilembus persalinus]
MQNFILENLNIPVILNSVEFFNQVKVEIVKITEELDLKYKLDKNQCILNSQKVQYILDGINLFELKQYNEAKNKFSQIINLKIDPKTFEYYDSQQAFINFLGFFFYLLSLREKEFQQNVLFHKKQEFELQKQCLNVSLMGFYYIFNKENQLVKRECKQIFVLLGVLRVIMTYHQLQLNVNKEVINSLFVRDPQFIQRLQILEQYFLNQFELNYLNLQVISPELQQSCMNRFLDKIKNQFQDLQQSNFLILQHLHYCQQKEMFLNFLIEVQQTIKEHIETKEDFLLFCYIQYNSNSYDLVSLDLSRYENKSEKLYLLCQQLQILNFVDEEIYETKEYEQVKEFLQNEENKIQHNVLFFKSPIDFYNMSQIFQENLIQYDYKMYSVDPLLQYMKRYENQIPIQYSDQKQNYYDFEINQFYYRSDKKFVEKLVYYQQNFYKNFKPQLLEITEYLKDNFNFHSYINKGQINTLIQLTYMLDSNMIKQIEKGSLVNTVKYEIRKLIIKIKKIQSHFRNEEIQLLNKLKQINSTQMKNHYRKEIIQEIASLHIQQFEEQDINLQIQQIKVM